MKRKRASLWIVCLVFVLTIVGCSSGGGGSAQPTAADNKGGADAAASSGKQVELRVAWWGSVARHEKYNKILDMYEKQNPNVKITREFAPLSDLVTKYATQAAAHNLPDLFGLHMLNNGAQFASKGVLEPLDDYIKRGVIKVDGWNKGILDSGIVNGVRVSIPKGITAWALLFNGDAIKRYGVEAPPANLSYKDFVTYAEQLKAKLPAGTYVIADSAKADATMAVFMRQKGKELFAADGKSLGFAKSDLIEFWSFWNDLRKKGISPPAQFTAEDAGKEFENSALVKGKVLAQFTNANQAKIWQSYTKDKFILHRTLTMPEGKSVGGEELAASNWAISKDSKNKEEAAKLLNWFVNDIEVGKLFNAELGVVGNPKVAEALMPTLDPLDAEGFKHMEIITKDIPNAGSRPENGPKAVAELMKFYDQIMFEKMTVEQAVDGAFTEVAKVLK